MYFWGDRQEPVQIEYQGVDRNYTTLFASRIRSYFGEGLTDAAAAVRETRWIEGCWSVHQTWRPLIHPHLFGHPGPNNKKHGRVMPLLRLPRRWKRRKHLTQFLSEGVAEGGDVSLRQADIAEIECDAEFEHVCKLIFLVYPFLPGPLFGRQAHAPVNKVCHTTHEVPWNANQWSCTRKAHKDVPNGPNCLRALITHAASYTDRNLFSSRTCDFN